MGPVEDAILKNLDVFVGFARSRLGDHYLAEDLVLDSLIKALTSDRQPDTDEATTTWFYRILRRSIIDVYRNQGARGRALERFEKELPETPNEQDEKELCTCCHRLLPVCRNNTVSCWTRWICRDPDAVSANLGLTRNNLTVRLHRARKYMRKALAANCGACSVHGCIDCTCNDSEDKAAFTLKIFSKRV